MKRTEIMLRFDLQRSKMKEVNSDPCIIVRLAS